MTISSTTTKVSYNGNGSTTVFAYTFKIFAAGDIEVIIRSSTGTETTKTLTTHYTVSGVGTDGGGNVTFVTAPASGETVVLRRNLTLTQGTDYVENDPFPANSHENALDRLTMITQGIQEELDRAIKASVTNTISSTEFTVSAADRANKLFAFDDAGDLSVTQEIGDYQGDWAASTTYYPRDIVKDTSNNNIYICNTIHTSSGSLPISSNADSAKWDLLVDAATATSSASAAASSATAAAASATAAAASASAAAADAVSTAADAVSTAADAVSTAADVTTTNNNVTAAQAAQAAAEAVFDNFDDAYLGAKASDPSVDNDGDPLADGALFYDTTNDVMKVYDLATTTWFQLTPTVSNQTNINTLAAIASDVTTAAGVASDITTAAGISANITTVAGVASNVTTVAGISSDVSTVAGDTTNIGTVATNIANVNNVGGSITNVNTVASNLSSVQNFANVYRVGATDPTTSLDTGDLFFNTTSSALKVYDGIAWTAGVTAGSGFLPTTGGSLTGDVTFGDNVKAIFGAGSDLQIYHDGSKSLIEETGTGSLTVRGTHITFQNGVATSTYANFVEGAEVSLRYNDSIKLSTTSSGVDIVGTVTSDGLTVDSGATSTSVTITSLGNAAPGNSGSIDFYRTNAGHNTVQIVDTRSADVDGGNLVIRTSDTLGTVRDRMLVDQGGDISFYDSTGTSQNLFWDASASALGIGTTSPTNATLEISATSNSFEGIRINDSRATPTVNRRSLDIRFTGTNGRTASNTQMLYLYDSVASSTQPFIQVDGSSSTHFVLDSSGNVGIGASSPATQLHLQTTAISGLTLERVVNGAGASTTLQPIIFGGPDSAASNANHSYAKIDTITTSITNGSESGDLRFFTSGSGTLSERARIDSVGTVRIGNSSGSWPGTDGIILQQGGVIQAAINSNPSLSLNRGVSNGTIAQFARSGTVVGSISVTTSSTAFNTSSDYRLKENVTELTGAIDRIKQVPVHRFNFIADPDKTVDGFLAHEVANVVPEAVHGEKDGMKTEEYEVTSAVLDDDGNVVTEAVMGTREVIEPQGIDQSKLVPLLTQALKDAITKIETLETRISILEGAN